MLLDDSLVPFTNAAAVAGNLLRFVHAYAGGPALDVGLFDPDSMELIPPPAFVAITYGTTATPGTSTSFGDVIEGGYVQPSNDVAVATVGAAPTGQTKVILSDIVDLGDPKDRVLTAYAVGKADDASYPLAGRLCDETKTTGALTSCAAF